jgi:hypothetical protein
MMKPPVYPPLFPHYGENIWLAFFPAGIGREEAGSGVDAKNNDRYDERQEY